MFRRLKSSLPKDFEFLADLEGLGYFINEDDQIRMIKDPSQNFHYFISKNERCLEMQREAMNECIRRNILERLTSTYMDITRLPLSASAVDRHVPILTSKNIAFAKRVIVYIGEACQDLGIFALRVVGQDRIASGSAINFVKRAMSARDQPGAIIANPGQLVWYRGGGKAMSMQSFNAIPRSTAVASGLKMDPIKNRIPQNGTEAEHMKCVFEQVVKKLTDPEATIDIIGIGDGAMEVIGYLQTAWPTWAKRIGAIAVGTSYIWPNEFIDPDFRDFFAKRGRAYLVSPEDIGVPLTGRKDTGCNCYSSGESSWTECIMPKAYEYILDYFTLVAGTLDYENVPQDISEEAIVDDWDVKSEGEAGENTQATENGDVKDMADNSDLKEAPAGIAEATAKEVPAEPMDLEKIRADMANVIIENWDPSKVAESDSKGNASNEG